jgi:hypothetical protein
MTFKGVVQDAEQAEGHYFKPQYRQKKPFK